MKVADLTTRLIGRTLYEPEVGSRITALDAYWEATREAEVLAGSEARSAMFEFGKFLQGNIGTLDKVLRGEGGEIGGFSARAEAERRKMLDAIRRELELREPTEKETD